MNSGELLVNLFFYLFALVAVAGAAAVALSKNIVRSAFALLAMLFATAAMYAFMRADFIVVAQIIIYVGGILVLIIFAVMLTHKITDVSMSNESEPSVPAFFATLVVGIILVISALNQGWVRTVEPYHATAPASGARPAATLTLRMWQGDGGTGVRDGQSVLDGYVKLEASTGGAPLASDTRIQFRVDRASKEGWTEARSREARLSEAGRGHLVATADIDRLDAGEYRWLVRVEQEDGFSDWIHFKNDGMDFKSEKGLTRSIGMAFMTRYLLPFEVVSVLLLAALVGAAYLARKEVKE